jgi:ribosomal protein S18 acetylase RimI-like enzyme
VILREKRHSDGARLASVWKERYGGTSIVSRGVEHFPLDLEGFVAEADGEMLGALTYTFHGGDLEVVTLDSFAENRGAGTALLAAAVEEARALGAGRAWLVTTNDNIRALRFYQRRGWDMAALHRDAVATARRIKPSIPPTGDHDIAIRHEIEFEHRLG